MSNLVFGRVRPNRNSLVSEGPKVAVCHRRFHLAVQLHHVEQLAHGHQGAAEIPFRLGPFGESPGVGLEALHFREERLLSVLALPLGGPDESPWKMRLRVTLHGVRRDRETPRYPAERIAADDGRVYRGALSVLAARAAARPVSVTAYGMG